MLRAFQVMTDEVIWIEPGAHIAEAVQIFHNYAIRHLPVLENGRKLVGIISVTDLLANCYSINRRIEVPQLTRIEEVMTKDVITCTPNCPLPDIAATMVTCKISSLVVLNDHELVGIITTSDILKSYCAMFENTGHQSVPLDRRDHGRF